MWREEIREERSREYQKEWYNRHYKDIKNRAIVILKRLGVAYRRPDKIESIVEEYLTSQGVSGKELARVKQLVVDYFMRKRKEVLDDPHGTKRVRKPCGRRHIKGRLQSWETYDFARGVLCEDGSWQAP